MVGAVMALMHLLGASAKSERQHLVAEADAEDRKVGFDKLLDGWNGIFAGRCRIAGAVGQEDAIRLVGQNVLSRCCCRQNGDLRAETGEQAQNVTLHAEVERDDVIFRRVLFAIAVCERPWRFLPCEALANRDVLGKIEIFKAAPCGGACLECVEVKLAARIMRDDSVLRASLTDE